MSEVHISAKHGVMGVPMTPQIRNLFPNAKELQLPEGPVAVVPHGVVETVMLRNIGFDVPAPIMSQYDWPHPIGQPPFEVQKKTAALLSTNQRSFCLNDMGTGKTRAALWAWDYLNLHGLSKKLLVVAPLSTLSFVWAREVFQALPHRRSSVLHGTKATRLARLADPDVDIFLINHDGLKLIAKDIVARGDIDAMVVDELAGFRNGQAQRSKNIAAVAAGMEWVWGMTGSPIPRCPTDVWAQCRVVNPSRVPKYYSRFRDELMLKAGPFKWVPKSDAIDKAFAAMQPSVRYKLEDVTELPDCIERTMDVELGTKQAAIYTKVARDCYIAVQNKEITAANAGACMNKLLQIASGYVYASDGSVVTLDGDARIAALVDAVESTDRKCLVFAPFKHALRGISAALTHEGIEHAVVSGDTPAGERNTVFTAFQETPKYHTIVAHPQCLAHGITLTAADTIVWFAPITSLEIYEQANRRIRRVGQGFKQQIIHLQGTPVEKRIYSLLQKNQQVQEMLLELFEAACN